MGEFELIGRFFAAASCAQAAPGVALGIGDDCALLQLAANEQLAVSTDTLVVGVHFPHSPDPFLLGQRTLAVAASDLAAMGADPLGFTLAITLPEADEAWLDGFSRGLSQMAASCSLALIGGDTTRGPLSLTVTVFGRVPRGQALTRAGAQVGDLLCVGGNLGDAAGALPLVLGQCVAEPAIADALLAHYWSPPPQLALGRLLRGRATSALDISDGLLADCGHIARASGVALQIDCQHLPLSSALEHFDQVDALSCALAGGDDYVLAFTLPAPELADLLAQWPALRVIGRVVAGDGVHLLDAKGQAIDPPRLGYQHFGGLMAESHRRQPVQRLAWVSRWLYLLSWLLLGSTPLVQADDTLPDRIRIVSDVWPGYTNADGTGLGWEIMRLVFEPAGIRLEHGSAVYTRGVGLVQRGEVEAWLGSYGSSEGYKGVFYPHRSYAIDPVSGLSLRSKPAPTLATLGSYRVVWMRGYGYERFLPGINGFREIERRSGVLSMLERRRVDLYIDALPEIADVLASSPEPDRYRITELTGLPLYPGFADTPRGRAFAALYDRRLEQVSRDGSLRRLYQRWEQPYLFDKYPESTDAAH